MAYGDGTFENRKGGYRYSVYYRCKIDDKTYRLSTVGKTKSECREKMKKKIAEKNAEVKQALMHSVENRNVRLQTALLDYIKREKYGKVKLSTYDRIERTLKNHIDDTDLGQKMAIEVTSKEISDFIEDLLGKHSESSVRKVYELLSQFYARFYEDDPCGNPMAGIARPKTKKNIGEIKIEIEDESVLEDMVLSDEEIEKFKTQVFLPPKNGVAGRPMHGVALYFMMMTLLRYGEASALVWGDIDIENRIMLVRRNQSIVKNRDEDAKGKTKRIMTTPKNGKAREVMLSKEALEALDEIKKRSHHTDKMDFVICSDSGKSLTNSNLRKTLDAVMKAAGLSRPGFGLHYLRHTGVSYYIRHDIPLAMVSKMAGHSSVAITERVYYHIIHDQQKKMLEMMDGISK